MNPNIIELTLSTENALLKGRISKLEEQLKIALGDVEGYHPICERCGRVCTEVTKPWNQIWEYTCHYCIERDALKEDAEKWRGYLDIIDTVQKRALEMGLHLEKDPLSLPLTYLKTTIDYIDEAARHIKTRNKLRDAGSRIHVALGVLEESPGFDENYPGVFIMAYTEWKKRLEVALGCDGADKLTTEEIETFFKDFMRNIDELAEIDDDPTDDEKKREKSGS